MRLENKANSLKRRLAEAEENLRLIHERKSEYVQSADIPLQLIKDERRLAQEIEALRAQLEQLPPPGEAELVAPTRPRGRTIAAGIAGLAVVLAVGAAALGAFSPQHSTTAEPSPSPTLPIPTAPLLSPVLSLEQAGDPLYPDCNVRAITRTPSGMLAALDSCEAAGVKRVGGSGQGADPGNPDGLLTSPLAVAERADGRLLVGTIGNGLVELASDRTVTRVHTQTADGSDIAVVGAVASDGADGAWVGIGGWEAGLHLLDAQGQWHTLSWENEKFAVYDIELDEKGRVWLATFGGGVRCLDPVTHAWTAVYNQRTCPGCLPSDTVFAIIAVDGRKWVGTDSGLAVLDDRGEQLVWQVIENLPHSRVTALAKDGEGHVFVGMEEGIDQGGLAIVDEELNVVKALTFNHSISALAFDPQQSQLWVGTLGEGLSIWSVRENSSTP
jgi:hypothetical protein